MESSKAINAIGSAFSGVFNFLKAPVKGGMDYLEETGKNGANRTMGGMAHAMFGSEDGKGLLDFGVKQYKKDAAGEIVKGADGKPVLEGTKYYSGAKIAGGLMGASLGYRFLSGGGAYRDKNGNTDIAGLPFV